VPSESLSAKKERTLKILAILRRTYPDAHCSLTHANPWQLLVATILSAQCTDARVNMVTPELFRQLPRPEDMAAADLPRIEKLIQTTGFYHSKAKSLHAAATDIAKLHDGNVPQSMDELVALHGVGRKTANVVLGNAFDINVGVVVDTHVSRVSQRLDLTRNTDPVKIERDLMKLVPQEAWTQWSHLLIYHGRAICTARNPKCSECPLLELCPFGQKVVHGTDRAGKRGKASKR